MNRQFIRIESITRGNGVHAYRLEHMGKVRGEETVAIIKDARLAEKVKALIESEPNIHVEGGLK